MKKKYLPILTLIVILMAANLACSFSTAFSTAPTAEPTRVIPVSTAAAQSFVQAFQQPTIDAQAGTQTIQFNEEQITSYVAYQLAQDPNQVIHNPQVYLENNQVILKGQIITDVLNSDGQISTSITVDNAGMPKVEILSAEFGSIQIPAPLLSAVTSMLDSAIRDNIKTDTYQIKSITMANHLMTIVLITRK
jgi:hypothetical protein